MSSVCTECDGDYKELNTFYSDHVQRSVAETDGVCFDLRDAINRTRRAWSDDFKCCKDRHESRLAFTLCASIVAVLPILFYGSAVLLRLRSERRDPLLLDDGGNATARTTPPAQAAPDALRLHSDHQDLLRFDDGENVASAFIDDDVSLLGGEAQQQPVPSFSGGTDAIPTVGNLVNICDNDDDDEPLDSDDTLPSETDEDEILRQKAKARQSGFR